MGLQRSEEYYYRLGENNDIENRDIPLQVNCCGTAYVPRPYSGGYPQGRRDFYLIYMLDGVMVGRVADSDIVMQKGDMICILAKTPCFFKSTEPMNEPIRYRWIHFTGYDAAREIAECGITVNRHYSPKLRDEVLAHFEKLFSEFRIRSLTANFNYATNLELRYILFLLGKSIADTEKSERLDLSLKYIHTHISEQLSVEELASMEYLGVSRYREVFRNITGVSPSEYITKLRIARAKELLSQGEFGIDETAQLVGYKDRLYFQRVFRKYEGVTPGEYRKLYIK